MIEQELYYSLKYLKDNGVGTCVCVHACVVFGCMVFYVCVNRVFAGCCLLRVAKKCTEVFYFIG